MAARPPFGFKPSWSERVTLRGVEIHLRHWGDAPDRPLILLHGWMDSSATFQFVVDQLAGQWHVIAPDWRGYGASQWLRRPYWFPDYYADLDALLTHCLGGEKARLVGHSMGASVAAAYAGARPERVAGLVMLDFIGLPSAAADEAPGRLGHWIAGIDSPPPLRVYKDYAELARRLRLSNPRLGEREADFLARHTGRSHPEGGVDLACDPWHRLPSPIPYRVEEAMACWRKASAPVLLLVAEDGFVSQRFASDGEELARREACFARFARQTIEDCGHNLHHDQPARVARAIEAFFAAVDESP